ncbi:MAG: erythromycin esterase family protein, partial [Planctomycetes bacterium]|nr:erythromycin esterase family protein [Planctomycetota bacterium]
NRKMIVWAHSGHLMRGSSQIQEIENKFKTQETVAAGQHLHDALGDGVYSIMITAYGGKRLDWRNEPHDLPAPPEGSLEDLFHRAGLKFGFVDLRGLRKDHWLRGRLVARPIAHHPMRADWGQVFDGVFFIDTMTPTSSIEPSP